MKSVAVPFFISRANDVIASGTVTTTRDTAHGLLRLDDDRLLVQWRMERTVDLVGSEIRSDKTIEQVRDVSIPLTELAAAHVRTRWWRFRGRETLVLIAADLRAFESLAGQAGLELIHPAELRVNIRSADREAAIEFAGELQLALAEQSLRRAERISTPGFGALSHGNRRGENDSEEPTSDQ